MTFITLNYEESISNIFFVLLGVLYNANVTLNGFLFLNILPLLLGNFISSVFFVGFFYTYIYLQSSNKKVGP